MQINTIWLQPLAHATGMAPEKVARRLVDDPCFNIAAAAAIVRVYLTEARGNVLAAVGLYHSHTPELGEAYRRKVLAAAMALFTGRR